MYGEHFGLAKLPFSLLPDPEFLFPSSKHKKALCVLQYGLHSDACFTVITGVAGSGKTTVMRSMLAKLNTNNHTVGLITNTHNNFGDLFSWIFAAFNITANSGDGIHRRLLFQDFVESERKQGRRIILIFDEAQNMDSDALEQLRQLSDSCVAQGKLFQVVLIGQPELLDKLNSPQLTQLSQSIAMDYHLEPLSFAETEQYIMHRIKTAGGKPRLFRKSASSVVYYFSEGIPRKINNICDLAMVFAFAKNSEIDWRTVVEVVVERKANGIRHFKNSLDLSDEIFNKAIELNKLRRAVLTKTKIDITKCDDSEAAIAQEQTLLISSS